MERLQKYMAHAGVASRRKSEDIIAAGRVKVNGKTVTEMGTKINPERDVVEVDGEIISREKRVYFMLHKPTGVISSVSDPRGRRTVLDLVDNIPQRIYPVGRLDYDSSGLLLLTNDGELTHIFTHPSFEIKKTYRVKVAEKINREKLRDLEEGVELSDGLTAPATVNNINQNTFLITIHEGKNRQVRRMCKKIGYRVVNLKRISLAHLNLSGLEEGEYRPLNEDEVEEIRKMKRGII